LGRGNTRQVIKNWKNIFACVVRWKGGEYGLYIFWEGEEMRKHGGSVGVLCSIVYLLAVGEISMPHKNWKSQLDIVCALLYYTLQSLLMHSNEHQGIEVE
jgi:hypothetical protein